MSRVGVWVRSVIAGLFLIFGAMSASVDEVHGGSVACTTTPGALHPTCATYLYLSYPFATGLWLSALVFFAIALLIGVPAWVASPLLAARRGSTARTSILVVSTLTSALGLLTLVVSLGASLTAQNTCLPPTGPGAQPCVSGIAAPVLGVVGLSLLPMLILYVVNLPAWIMALVETTRARRWRWVAAIVVLSPFATLAYAIFGERRMPAPPSVSASLSATP